MNTTKLHVIFVGKDRKVIRELYSDCKLFRSKTDVVEIPYISFDDTLLQNIFGGTSILKFYDESIDKFNFKVSDMCDLISNDCELPDEIQIEFLEIDGTYIHLEPGLWKMNKNNELYRVCDDAMNHIVLDQLCDEEYDETDEDGNFIKHHTLMDNFFFAIDRLNLFIIDDDDDDCCGDCDNCDNIDCQNTPDEDDYESEFAHMDTIDNECDGCTGDCETCGQFCDTDDQYTHEEIRNKFKELDKNNCNGNCETCGHFYYTEKSNNISEDNNIIKN